MCPLALGRLRQNSMKMPQPIIAISACATFQCPKCKQYIALMTVSVEWIERNWWENIDNLGLEWNDDICICKHCQEEVDKALCYTDNWDQIYFMPKPRPPGGLPFV